MKNIYEDGTIPGTPEVPQVKRQTDAPPTRPRKQVTPTPMQQEQLLQQKLQQQQQQLAQQQMPYGAMPVYGMPSYPYVQVGVDANGQPLYAPSMPYPQGAPVYPYAPYMQPAPQMPQPAPVPEQPAVPKTEQDPGTRVLYQSPDFDKPDGEKHNKDVGASFAQGSFRQQMPVTQEEIEVEEVSFSAPEKSVTILPESENIEIDEVDFDASQLEMLMKEKQTARKEAEAPEKKASVTAKGKGKTRDKDKGNKAPLPKNEIIRRSVLGVSIAAIIISAGMLLNEYRLAQQNEDVEQEVSDLIIEEATTKKNNKNDKDKQDVTEVQLTPEQQWAQIKMEYPNVIFPANIQLKYAKLYAENQDFVGYLSADGVGLNLPVVQAEDDEEYLKKNFYGKTTKYGCPFVTHLNNIDPLDMNTVIFGHHMNNNTIFGTLDAYKKIDGFKKAPVITFNTLNKDYSFKVIAAFITNAYGKDDLKNYVFPYYFTNLSSYDRFSAYLNELSQRSLYDTGVDVVATDKLLTLSTCSHEFDDARFVVVARLVRPGEGTAVDTSKAVVNSNPRYPQAYYNAKKIKTNPYKNASQWQVG